MSIKKIIPLLAINIFISLHATTTNPFGVTLYKYRQAYENRDTTAFIEYEHEFAKLVKRHDINQPIDRQKRTILMLCADTPYYPSTSDVDAKIISLLLQYGANIDQQDIFGKTALMHAANNTHCAIIETLINSKANPNKQDIIGQTAIDYLFIRWLPNYMYKQVIPRCIELMCTTPHHRFNPQYEYEQDNALLKSIFCNHIPIVSQLLSYGFDINSQNKESGFSALHSTACHESYHQIGQFLIDSGIDQTLTDNNDETALEILLY